MKAHFPAAPKRSPARLAYHQRPAVRLTITAVFLFFLSAASPHRTHHLDEQIHRDAIQTGAHAHAPYPGGKDLKGGEFLPVPPNGLRAGHPSMPRLIQCIIAPGAFLGLVDANPLRFSATFCDASAQIGFADAWTPVRLASSPRFGISGFPLLAIRAPPSRAS